MTPTEQITASLDAIRERADKAKQTVYALCDGTMGWTMRVPAEPNRDPDLVIAAALCCIPALVDALRVAVEALKYTQKAGDEDLRHIHEPSGKSAPHRVCLLAQGALTAIAEKLNQSKV